MARAFVGSYGTTSHLTKYGSVSTGGSNVGFHPIVIAGSIPVRVTRGVGKFGCSRLAHNQEIGGSNPPTATNNNSIWLHSSVGRAYPS